AVADREREGRVEAPPARDLPVEEVGRRPCSRALTSEETREELRARDVEAAARERHVGETAQFPVPPGGQRHEKPRKASSRVAPARGPAQPAEPEASAVAEEPPPPGDARHARFMHAARQYHIRLHRRAVAR